MTPQVVIYTDGACAGNPGPGGWGAVLIFGEREKDICGGEPATTNNRMELTAAIEALNALNKPCRVELYTDSQYVKNGITEWLRGWKARGWKTYSKGAVKNEDLWRRLDEARLRHDVTWKWVKGHAGHPLNERADELARRGMNEARAAAKRTAAAQPKPAPATHLPEGSRDPARTPRRRSSGLRPPPEATAKGEAAGPPKNAPAATKTALPSPRERVGRGTAEGGGGAHSAVETSGERARPLHHASHGPPPHPERDGEEKPTPPAAPSAGRRRRRR